MNAHSSWRFCADSKEKRRLTLDYQQNYLTLQSDLAKALSATFWKFEALCLSSCVSEA